MNGSRNPALKHSETTCIQSVSKAQTHTCVILCELVVQQIEPT